MPRLAKNMSQSEINKLNKTGIYALGHIAGLSLRITNALSRYYCFRYTICHKTRLLNLGNANALTLKKAIAAAMDYKSYVLKGIDPFYVIKDNLQKTQDRIACEEKLKKDTKYTFKNVADEYIAYKKENHAFDNNQRAEQTIKSIIYNHAIPKLQDLLISKIQPRDIKPIFTNIWCSKPSLSSKLLSYLKGIFDYAIAQNYRDDVNPINMNGALGTLLTPLNTKRVAKGHYPCLDYKQIPEFMKALREFSNSLNSQALIFSILTATRSKAVRFCTWEQLDLVSGIWEIPLENDKTKKKNANRIIYLSTQAIDLLKSLPRCQSTNLVFHNTQNTSFSDAALSSVVKYLNIERESKGLEPFVDYNIKDENGKPKMITQHGTARATFKIWSKSDELGNNRKFDVDAVELCLLHQRKDPLHGAYDRSAFKKERRIIMQAWGDYCFSLIINNFK